jgi:uracil phosphoribosyltransferase
MTSLFAVYRFRVGGTGAAWSPSKAALFRMGADLSTGEIDEGTYDEIQLRDSDFSNREDESTRRDAIFSRLQTSSDGGGSLILDLRYGQLHVSRPAEIESFLGGIMATALDAFAKIVVLVETKPVDVDERYMALSHRVEDGTALFVPLDGDCIGGPLLHPDTLRECSPSLAAYQELIDSRMLRRRGVFESSSTEDALPRHSRFRFSGDLCKVELQHYIESYMRLKFDGLGSAVLIVHSPTSDWLLEPAKKAGAAARVDTFIAEDVTVRPTQVPKSSPAVHAPAIISDASEVLVATPMVVTGQTLRPLLKRIREMTQAPLSVLATVNACRSESIEFDGGEAQVDGMLSAPSPFLPADAWQVRAARVSKRVEAEDKEWRRPSTIGMWDLFTEVGFGVEDPRPQRRPAVDLFPQLAVLSSRDALWLAYSIVRIATDYCEARLSEIVFVLPEEPTGARPIAAALENGLEALVCRLPREAIDCFEATRRSRDGVDAEWKDEVPASTLSQIAKHGGKHIVVVDESTVTYGTLRSMASMVERLAQSSVQITIVAMEAAHPGEPQVLERLECLSWWTSLLDA